MTINTQMTSATKEPVEPACFKSMATFPLNITPKRESEVYENDLDKDDSDEDSDNYSIDDLPEEIPIAMDKMTLNDNSESHESDDEDKDGLVAKGPDKGRTNRNDANPYSRAKILQCGGGVITATPPVSCIPPFAILNHKGYYPPQIPETVQEISQRIEERDEEVDFVLNNTTPDQINVLFDIIDSLNTITNLSPSNSVDSGFENSPPQDNQFSPGPIPKYDERLLLNDSNSRSPDHLFPCLIEGVTPNSNTQMNLRYNIPPEIKISDITEQVRGYHATELGIPNAQNVLSTVPRNIHPLIPQRQNILPVHSNNAQGATFHNKVDMKSIYTPGLSCPASASNSFQVQEVSRLPELLPDMVRVSEGEMQKSAYQRLKDIFLKKNKRVLEVEWGRVALIEEWKFYEKDINGQVKLIDVLLENCNDVIQLAKIFAYVERIKKIKSKCLEILEWKNHAGENALSLAALKCNNQPIIARYIADTIVEFGGDPDQIYDDGNSILHHLARCGDEYVHVLAELLNCRKLGRNVFEINRTNITNETPLHFAAKTHSASTSCLAIAKILVKHKAKLCAQDENCLTPLHLAVKKSCDTSLVKSLLQREDGLMINAAVNFQDKENNTALHFAALRNDVPFIRQKKVISLLVDYKATHNMYNKNGCLALSLVDPSRKEEIRSILNRK